MLILALQWSEAYIILDKKKKKKKKAAAVERYEIKKDERG